MNSKRFQSVYILETPFSTVTSGGHWFHATRQTIEEYTPGLMKKYSFEELISKAVVWINSADSLALIFFYALAFVINPWIAAGVVFLFHIWWYHQKSAFVNRTFTPLLSLFGKDFFQLLLAAFVLSFMGISGMYTAVLIGIIYFFLFKIGILRRVWDRLNTKTNTKKLPLNDRVLKMVLVRYSIYENIPPKDVEKLDRHVQQSILEANKKSK